MSQLILEVVFVLIPRQNIHSTPNQIRAKNSPSTASESFTYISIFSRHTQATSLQKQTAVHFGVSHIKLMEQSQITRDSLSPLIRVWDKRGLESNAPILHP